MRPVSIDLRIDCKSMKGMFGLGALYCDCTAAEWNYVAAATRRRREILQA